MAKKNIVEPDFREGERLKHILFIIDGNGRWAKKRLMPRTYGHAVGVKRLKQISEECFLKYNIPYVSFFCFSTENWNRPKDEIETFFKLMKQMFNDFLPRLIELECKISIVGFLDDPRIDKGVLKVIQDSMEKTKNFNKYHLMILFNYGGKQDILQATKSLLKENIDIGTIDEEELRKHLLVSEYPDIDCLVRTSGEKRISNCCLYTSAYAEYVFPSTYWPDFDEKELKKVLEEYNSRNRRFGAIKNE